MFHFTTLCHSGECVFPPSVSLVEAECLQCLVYTQSVGNGELTIITHGGSCWGFSFSAFFPPEVLIICVQ